MTTENFSLPGLSTVKDMYKKAADSIVDMKKKRKVWLEMKLNKLLLD